MKTRAFTLVELLVVIAILSILATLAVLGIGSLSGGNKLTTAGNAIVDTVNKTRQAAQSHNALGVFVVLSNQMTAGFLYEPATTNWQQIERWASLPEGITFDTNSSSNTLSPPSQTNFPLRSGTQQSDYGVMTFLPDGRPWPGIATTPMLTLRKKVGPSANYYKILINPATGVPFVRRP